MDQAEDRGIGPDPERQGDDRDRGERRIPPQRADPVAQVPQERVDGGPGPGLAYAFPHWLRATEGQSCGPSRLGRAETLFLLGIGGQLEERGQLVVEIALAASTKQEVPEPAHRGPQTVSITRWMAKVRRSQCWRSVWSCRRPAAVRR